LCDSITLRKVNVIWRIRHETTGKLRDMTENSIGEDKGNKMAHAVASAELERGYLHAEQTTVETVHRCRIYKLRKPWGRDFLSVVWDSLENPYDCDTLPKGVVVFDEESRDVGDLSKRHREFICESGLRSGSHALRNSL